MAFARHGTSHRPAPRGLQRSSHAPQSWTLLLALILAGCAGVGDSFVSLEQPGVPPPGSTAVPVGDTASRQRQLAESKYADLDAAIGYAEAAKLKYKDAVVNQGRLTSWTGAAAIPVGAVALGIAALGGSTTTASILGLSSAGALGAASWLRNPPAQAAYLGGYTAVNCAIEAVLPLKLPAAQSDLLNTRSVQLAEALVQLREAITELQAVVGAGSGASSLLVSATAVAEAGADALKNANRLSLQINQAGNQLVTTVDRIAGEVDLAVLTNQANLAAIPAVLGGLAQSYGQLSPVPLPRPPERAVGVQQSQSPAADKVIARSQEVALLTRELASVLTPVIGANPAERLKACGVDPAAVAAPLTIGPANPIVIDRGAQRGLWIEGGQEPITVDLPDAPRGIQLRPRDVSGRNYLIATTSEAKLGVHTLIVRDRSGRTKTGEIEVRSATGGAADRGGNPNGGVVQPRPDPVSVASDPIFDALPDDAQRTRLQTALCLSGVNVTGRWGPLSRARLSDYQAAVGLPVTGRLNADLVEALLGHSEAKIEQRCKERDAHRLLLEEVAAYYKDKPQLWVSTGIDPAKTSPGDGEVTYIAKSSRLDPSRNLVTVVLGVEMVTQPSGNQMTLPGSSVFARLKSRAADRRGRPGINALPNGYFRITVTVPPNLRSTLVKEGEVLP